MSTASPQRFLIDAPGFKEELATKIAAAKTRVLVQAMTFECDDAGNWLLGLMNQSQARHKVLCVDAYSLMNINDGWAFRLKYWRNRAFKAEVDATRALLKSGNAGDVRVHLTNRLGPWLHTYPARNHKKLVIIDDEAYLGGLNFSDHNFAWHDLMVRIEDREVVEALTEDFHATLQGKSLSKKWIFDESQLFAFDGRNSRELYMDLFQQIASAQSSVRILSPYLSEPLLSVLKKLPANVQVQIITPAVNNKSIMKDYLLAQSRATSWQIFQYQGIMSHAKALLIDDRILIVGSSNYDFVSYHLEEEIVWCTEEPELVQEFTERVWFTDLASSLPEKIREKRFIRSFLIIFVLRRVMALLGLIIKRSSDH